MTGEKKKLKERRPRGKPLRKPRKSEKDSSGNEQKTNLKGSGRQRKIDWSN